MYKVYCCTDVENGYKYIGVTYKNIRKRLSEHYNAAMHTNVKSPFKVAIRNGRKFEYSIIEDNIKTLSEALRLEKHYIDKYRTCVHFEDCKGYNGSVGGEYYNSVDDRDFIFKYDYNYNFIQVYVDIEKLASELGLSIGKLVDMLDADYIKINGYIYTYYDYKIPKKDKPVSDICINNKGKGINQYTLDGVFVAHYNSGEDAAKAVGTYSSSIVKVCKGKHHSHKGYIWRYADSYTDTSNLEKKDIENALNNQHNKREVVQLDLNGSVIKIFESVPEASRYTGISINNIRAACVDMKLSAGGYKWKFRNSSTEIKHRRSIVQMDLYGNIINTFESMMKASEITGVSRSGIYDCCSGRSKTAGGYKWSYNN